MSEVKKQLSELVIPFEEQPISTEEAMIAGEILANNVDELFLEHAGYIAASNQEIIDGLDSGEYDDAFFKFNETLFDNVDLVNRPDLAEMASRNHLWSKESFKQIAQDAPDYIQLQFKLTGNDRSELFISLVKNNPRLYADNMDIPSITLTLSETFSDGSVGKWISYNSRFDENGQSTVRRIEKNDWQGNWIYRQQKIDEIPKPIVKERQEMEDYLTALRSVGDEERANFSLEAELGLNDLPVGIDEINNLLKIVRLAQPMSKADINKHGQEVLEAIRSKKAKLETNTTESQKVKRTAHFLMKLLIRKKK